MRPLFRRRTQLQRLGNVLQLAAGAIALAWSRTPTPARIGGAIVLLVAIGVALPGCTTTQQVQTVKVAVPVECREKIPDRPVLPVDGVQEGASLTQKVKALAASIELLEGYAGQLLAGLQGCTKPIAATEGVPGGH